MISWDELSGTVNFAYKRSIDVAELSQKAALLEKEMADGWMNEKNYQSAEALLVRTKAKIYALKYFLDGYVAEDYDALLAFIEDKLSSERIKTYTNTVAVLNNLKAYLQAVYAIMSDAEEKKLNVIGSRGEYVSDKYEEYDEAVKIFGEKIEAANGLAEWKSVFGTGVVFPDVKAQVIADLTEIYNLSKNRSDKLRFGNAEKIYKENVKLIDEREGCRYYEFYPLLSGDESKPANAMILYTPFETEATLCVIKNCSGEIGAVEASAFDSFSVNEINNFFSVAQRKKTNLIVYGLDQYRGGYIDAILQGAIAMGKSGVKIFLVDFTGSRESYNKALAAARSGGMSIMDISYFYITMPMLEDVCNLFKELGLISSVDEEREYIRKNMPFMGFAGLNEAIIAFKAGNNWRAVATSYSESNKSSVNRYLDNLPTQSLLVEKNWGDYSEDVVIEKNLQFDYDDLNDIDKINIKKIMQKHINVFAKCGCVVRYCTLAGSDKSVWTQLDVKTQEERLTKATRMIFRILTVPLEPEVKILDVIDNDPGIAGQCCDGGKLILYKASHIQNYDGIISTICHESYHAFQSLVMYGAWSDWYWTEFGVTQGRRGEWLVNTNNTVMSTDSSGNQIKIKGKYFSSKDFDAYYVQVSECEARAFAKDCIREANAVWHEIDFE